MLNLTKALMKKKRKGMRLVYLCGGDLVNPVDEGISGFMKSLRQENPKYEYSLVEIEAAKQFRSGEIALYELSEKVKDDIEIRYTGAQRC